MRLAAGLALSLAACGGEVAPGALGEVQEADGGAGGAPWVVDDEAWPCGPAETLSSEGGPCVPVGPKDCDERFVDAEGRCVLDPALCPGGTVPVYGATGESACQAVGPAHCPAPHREAGRCLASVDKCPKGQIPDLREGAQSPCRKVGLPVCAAPFVALDPDRHGGGCVPTLKACPEGTFAVPSRGCLPIDGPEGCGEGPFGALSGVADVYVDASARGPADGSEALPFSDLKPALEAAPDGALIALAAGEYDDAIVLNRDMHLRGRCASMVRLVGSSWGPEAGPAVVVVEGGLVRLADLQIASGVVPAVSVYGAEASLEGVHVSQAFSFGVLATEGEIALDEVLIEGLIEDPVLSRATGVLALEGARAEVSASTVSGGRAWAVDATGGGAQIVLTDVLVEGNRDSTAESGAAAIAFEGGHVQLVRSAVVDCEGTAVRALQGSASVVDSLIAPTEGGALGEGLSSEEGSLLTAQGVVVLSAWRRGLLASDAQASLLASLIEDTRLGDIAGRAATASRAGRLAVEDSALVGSVQSAVLLDDAGSSGELVRTVIEGVAPNAAGHDGMGLQITEGTRAPLVEDLVIRGAHLAGVFVQGEATLRRVLVTGTQPAPAPDVPGGGEGIFVAPAGEARLERVHVYDNAKSGIFAGPDASIEIDASLVEATRGIEGEPATGRGIDLREAGSASVVRTTIANCPTGGLRVRGGVVLTEGLVVADCGPSIGVLGEIAGGGVTVVEGELELSGASVLRNEALGVAARGAGTELRLWDSAVSGTQEDRRGLMGVGLWVQDGALVDVDRALLDDNQMAGAVVFGGTLRGGRSVLSRTREGRYIKLDGEAETLLEGLADGVMSVERSKVELALTRALWNGRAGYLLHESRGCLEQAESAHNGLALVVQAVIPGTAFEVKGLSQSDNQAATALDLSGPLEVADEPLPPASFD